LSLVFPIVGIVNYMLVYQLHPGKMWWGQPLEDLGIRYSMTAAMCLVLGMLLSAGRVPKSRKLLGSWLLLVLLFTSIVLWSFALNPGTTDYGAILADKMVKMAIFLICLVRMGATRDNFKILLWTFVAGTIVIGYDALGAPQDDFADGRLNFVGGPDFRESSGLAVHMAAMIPLIGVVFMISKAKQWRVVAMIAGILAVNTIVLCRTRSAFVGLLAGGVVALMMVPRGWRLKIYASIIIASIGTGSLTDQHFWDRMKTIAHPNEYAADGAIQSRIELWAVAREMFLDHPFGVGVGRFKDYAHLYNTGDYLHAFEEPGRVAHNSYLLCITELGIQGFTVFILIICVVLLRLRRCIRLAGETDDPPDSRLLAYGCFLSVIIYLTSAAFTDRLYTESFWWVLALPICLERALSLEVVEQEEFDLELTPSRNPSYDDDFIPIPTADSPRCALG
jgi:O-antigen ligase